MARINESELNATLPKLSIEDITVGEGNQGLTEATFTVSLSQASSEIVTVNYQTFEEANTIPQLDYLPVSGSLSFAKGETEKNITVSVIGDRRKEENDLWGDRIDRFRLELSDPVNAELQNDYAYGYIVDDDLALNPTTDAADGVVVLREEKDVGYIVEVDDGQTYGNWFLRTWWIPSPKQEFQSVIEFDLGEYGDQTFSQAVFGFYIRYLENFTSSPSLEIWGYDSNGIVDTTDYDAGSENLGYLVSIPEQQHFEVDATELVNSRSGNHRSAERVLRP